MVCGWTDRRKAARNTGPGFAGCPSKPADYESDGLIDCPNQTPVTGADSHRFHVKTASNYGSSGPPLATPPPQPAPTAATACQPSASTDAASHCPTAESTPSLRSRSVDAGDDRFGFGKVPAEWRAADRTSDIPGHRVDQPRPRSGSGHRYVLSIVVPQGDDALDTQEWDSEHPGQETDLDQHGGRRSVAEPDVAVSIPSRRR